MSHSSSPAVRREQPGSSVCSAVLGGSAGLPAPGLAAPASLHPLPLPPCFSRGFCPFLLTVGAMGLDLPASHHRRAVLCLPGPQGFGRGNDIGEKDRQGSAQHSSVSNRVFFMNKITPSTI